MCLERVTMKVTTLLRGRGWSMSIGLESGGESGGKGEKKYETPKGLADFDLGWSRTFFFLLLLVCGTELLLVCFWLFALETGC